MAGRYDVAILGAGPGGEHAAYALHAAGRKVALIERELIGGECTNWACIPTKTLLRPTEVRGETQRAAGIHEASLNWPDLSVYRDYMTSAGDDSARESNYASMGVDVVRGSGRLSGPGVLDVEGTRVEADQILISTGSEPVIPPVPGLAESSYWTNREVTALHELPASVVIIGGGPVGVELAQFLRRFECAVTLVQGSERLVEREDQRVSEPLEQTLRADGIDVRTAAQATRVSVEGGDRVVALDDGSTVRGERLVVAVGRRRDAVHPPGQVPGPDRHGRHGRTAGGGRLPSDPAGDLQ
jgi:pyruvate/2-oxoglutarate dehydrogenase complex dihydrolipoamide dehydrogenase (E3) component